MNPMDDNPDRGLDALAAWRRAAAPAYRAWKLYSAWEGDGYSTTCVLSWRDGTRLRTVCQTADTPAKAVSAALRGYEANVARYGEPSPPPDDAPDTAGPTPDDVPF